MVIGPSGSLLRPPSVAYAPPGSVVGTSGERSTEPPRTSDDPDVPSPIPEAAVVPCGSCGSWGERVEGVATLSSGGLSFKCVDCQLNMQFVGTSAAAMIREVNMDADRCAGYCNSRSHCNSISVLPNVASSTGGFVVRDCLLFEEATGPLYAVVYGAISARVCLEDGEGTSNCTLSLGPTRAPTTPAPPRPLPPLVNDCDPCTPAGGTPWGDTAVVSNYYGLYYSCSGCEVNVRFAVAGDDGDGSILAALGSRSGINLTVNQCAAFCAAFPPCNATDRVPLTEAMRSRLRTRRRIPRKHDTACRFFKTTGGCRRVEEANSVSVYVATFSGETDQPST